MCGIIISDLVIPKNASKFVEKRGPDDTNEISYKDKDLKKLDKSGNNIAYYKDAILLKQRQEKI